MPKTDQKSFTFKPLNGRILVKPDKKEETTKSGIIIATKEEERPVTGIVVVGNDDVMKGEKILFSKFGYDELTIDDEKFYVVSSANVLGIF